MPELENPKRTLTKYSELLSSPVEGIRVVACPLPFSTVRVERILPADQTISQILKTLGVNPTGAKDAHVLIGDTVIAREHWGNVKPKKGQTVTVRVVPRGSGGGKGFLRIIIGVAGVIAGAISGGLAAPLFGVAAGTAGAATASSIGGAIGGLAANLAANALIPPPRPKTPSRLGLENSPSVAGAGNRPAPYEPFPKIFGNHRCFPSGGIGDC